MRQLLQILTYFNNAFTLHLKKRFYLCLVNGCRKKFDSLRKINACDNHLMQLNYFAVGLAFLVRDVF